jgi:DNA helicase-2/ATP-dependent DNA helicase PcrA
MSEEVFEKEYKKLNKAQKEAVDAIDGPVMVVAGPGTGKTQILALRIGNILKKTDTLPDGILCLTFTNSAVSAMKERLRNYIGSTASKVNVSTFHSFGMKLVEEYYETLDLDEAPKLLDEIDSIALCDEILHGNDWKYIRPRSDASKYFRDLKSLISVLKRGRTSPEDFFIEIERDIDNLKEDEGSISTRGESKGQLKKEVLKKIESLERSKEVMKFYELYEKVKKEKNVFDYDDVLESIVRIVENSDDVRDNIREKYLYILIDEHQDSSGVQNEFLQKVWGDVEKPNIFVVGDDRQLIYGFSGASLSYFEGFKHSFGKAKLITLLENYRSTQVILDSAHLLLESKMTKDKLISHHKEAHQIRLVEAEYPRDEIIACGLDIKEKIKKGIDLNDCVILVPKNRQARSAAQILHDMDLPVSSYSTLRLFDQEEAQSFFRVLRIINNPYDSVSLAESFFDKLSGIEPLNTHKFIALHEMKKFSLVTLKEEEKTASLFEKSPEKVWVEKLSKWLKESQTLNVYSLVQLVGEEFLLDKAKEHKDLISRVEIIRTVLHLVLSQIEKNPKLNLKDFLTFIERIEAYGEDIPLSVFGAEEGIKILTLHSSKGLEFDYVWIAHMDEKSLVSGKRQGFTLPKMVEEKIEEKGEEVIKRQLYVAITRAKRFCTLSYAIHSYTGGDQELAHIVADLPAEVFEKQNAIETEKIILKHNPKSYVEKGKNKEEKFGLGELVKLVEKEYEDRNVSVSLLNNFFECPWKWYFRNLLKLPEIKSESLEFGNAVHASIDAILKIGEKPSVKQIEEITNTEVLKREYGDERKQKSMQKEVLGIVSRWVKERLGEIESNYENEKSVSFRDERFPHLNIYGKLDLIEKLDEENVRVTDFKTGSVRKKSEIEKIDEEGRMSGYLRQLAMYSYLLEQSPKWKVYVRESRLEFLEAKDSLEAFYDRLITNKEIQLLIKDITDYDNLVKNGEWIKRPCNYNSYGKNTECEYCKRANIYKS